VKGWSGRRPGEAAVDIGRTALLGCVVGVLLASSVAVVSAATKLDLGPKVGDILVFRPTAQVPDDWEFAVRKYTGGTYRGQSTGGGQSAGGEQPTGRCTLQPDVMASGGGSLVVEQRLDHPGSRTFRVHWAGAHTGNGASDCGGAADLVVSGPDLQLLTNAVGGPGVEHEGFPDY
jgi:hypothetical protein